MRAVVSHAVDINCPYIIIIYQLFAAYNYYVKSKASRHHHSSLSRLVFFNFTPGSTGATPIWGAATRGMLR
ncbi:hypothetical protein F5Y00DRAFT_200011 [Daldinia vernicosa]|uniref:uncharacterized protein n=1 Tax=Daldinia vernicosa TaxID=114800 RepID=UPI002007344B|nr:uncharacterized protein F5Y00DRAFT_200011 [Daldinia vernicosa]KAI0844425.1 hypothetical protein F5Y00DRAFT_200011 [Daldinia vernicosa]